MSDDEIQKHKKIVQNIFAKRSLRVRVRHRSGIRAQRDWRFGPKNLVPVNPDREFASVFLWIEAKAIHKIISYPHSEIPKLNLQQHEIGRERFLTRSLSSFPARYVFSSLADLKRRFPWPP